MPTRLWPRHFLTWLEGNFFKNLKYLGDIFQIQTQNINGWPNLARATKNLPERDSSLGESHGLIAQYG